MVIIIIIFVAMKDTLSLSLRQETILAVRDYCNERNITISAYVQILLDTDINSGFNGVNNSNSEELVLSYDNEVLTANEARLLLKNHPCRKMLYI